MRIGFILLTSLLFACSAEERSPPDPEAMALDVIVATVAQEEVSQQVRVFGSLYAKNDAVISSQIAAPVTVMHAEEGAWVEQDQLILELDSKTQKAVLAKAEAEVKLNELEYRRIKNLFAKKAIAEQELDKVRTALDSKKAERDSAAAELAKTQVRAPFSGRLNKRLVSIGDYVMPGTALLGLVDNRRLKVTYQLPERFLSQLQMGQHVELSLLAYPDEIFTAKTDFIAPKIDGSTRSIIVEATLMNEGERLSSGLSSEVTHILAQLPDVITIAEESIMSSIEGKAVYRVQKTAAGKTRAERVLIEAGLPVNGRVPVMAGLQAGDQIVTQGLQKLRDGQYIRISSAADEERAR